MQRQAEPSEIPNSNNFPCRAGDVSLTQQELERPAFDKSLVGNGVNFVRRKGVQETEATI
ncbi:MAG TPA: hypothetical protein DEP53_15430 [Bacteroidetes bacterium]|nr:hypothetical protein [Bacteroidota bacterium]